MPADLAQFNQSLKATSSHDDRLQFMRANILHGTPFVFTGREADYFQFRNHIASKFGVGFHEVFIVGSAKLGFSYTKSTVFSLNSDIDVVLVNSRKFDDMLKSVRDFDYEILRGRVVLDTRSEKRYFEFLRYAIRGWIRPDLLPLELQIGKLRKEWFQFFNSISHGKSSVGNYKVTAGLFKDYDHLERYYLSSIEKHYNTLRT